MTSKSLVILIVVTVIVAVAALFPPATPDPREDAEIGQIVLPAVARSPSAADMIEFSGGGEQVTLMRRPTGGTIWVVGERDNYKADEDKVGKALLGLARLRLIEPKTRRADRYSRLAVEDPGSEDAKSVLVRIRDSTGATLGEIIVGKTRPDRLGDGDDGTYVRRPNEAQSWLAEGSVVASAIPSDWLDKTVASIPASRIRQAVTTRPDGSMLTLSRVQPADEFTLPDAPADAKYTAPFRRNDLAGVLDGLTLTDVRAVATFHPSEEKAITAVWTSFDGLTVTATLIETDGAPWLRLSAAATDEKAEGETRKLNAEWSRWVYAIPDAKADAIKVKRADIVNPPKPS